MSHQPPRCISSPEAVDWFLDLSRLFPPGCSKYGLPLPRGSLKTVLSFLASPQSLPIRLGAHVLFKRLEMKNPFDLL